MNEVIITVTVNEADLLLKGLMELPYKTSAQLIQKMDTQVREQLNGDKKAD